MLRRLASFGAAEVIVLTTNKLRAKIENNILWFIIYPKPSEIVSVPFAGHLLSRRAINHCCLVLTLRSALPVSYDMPLSSLAY